MFIKIPSFSIFNTSRGMLITSFRSQKYMSRVSTAWGPPLPVLNLSLCEAPVVTAPPAQTAVTSLLCKSLPQRPGSQQQPNYILTRSSFRLIPFILPCLVVQEPARCRSDSAGQTGSLGPASVTAAALPTL